MLSSLIVELPPPANPQEKRITRLANKARSLVEAYAQASIVVPLAVPPLPLKSVLPAAFDPASTWHTSALLATAIETATLPSRLRHTGGSLTYLADLLNATGKQSVANLQMSVVQPWRQVKQDARERRRTEGWDLDGDESEYGGGSSGSGSGSSSGIKMDGDLQLPIDFAPRDESDVVASRLQHQQRKRPRMFGQAIVTRANTADDSDGDDAHGDGEQHTGRGSEIDHRDMMHRRFALKPVSQRYTVPLGFPLLDSFPYIYQPTTHRTGSIPVTTALATDRGVADRIQALRTTVTVGALWAIGTEDREALGNDLAGMADAYHDGWSSGSDDGDDED